MAITFIDSAEYNDSNSSSAVVDVSGITIEEGDLLVAMVGGYAGHTVNSPPSGWTEQEHDTYSHDEYLYTKVAGASEPSSYTWGFANSDLTHVSVHVFRGGFDTADAVEDTSVYNSGQSEGDTVLVAASVTAAEDASPIIWGGLVVYDTPIVTFTPPSGYADDWDGGTTDSQVSAGIAHGEVDTGATGTLTGAISSSRGENSKVGFALVLNPPATSTTYEATGTVAASSGVSGDAKWGATVDATQVGDDIVVTWS